MTDREQLADELAEWQNRQREDDEARRLHREGETMRNHALRLCDPRDCQICDREREADREALRNHQAGICGKKCPVCEARNS